MSGITREDLYFVAKQIVQAIRYQALISSTSLPEEKKTLADKIDEHFTKITENLSKKYHKS